VTGDEALETLREIKPHDMSEGELFDCRDALEVHSAKMVQIGTVNALAEALCALDSINNELDRRDEEYE
jgi:hypothetical protein